MVVDPPTSPPPARLTAVDLEIPAAATGAELEVRLAAVPRPAALLAIEIELPNGLSLPPSDRLVPSTPLVTLDGDWQNQRFVVLCGDAQNVAAAPLPIGPLFRLRLLANTPRTPGTYPVRLLARRASTSGGENVTVDTSPTTVNVIVR